MENNRKIAAHLRQIAALLEEQGVAFKPAAYRRAAKVIEELKSDVAVFKNEKELMELPGIGAAIAGKIREYLMTGHIKTLEQLLATQGGIPPALMEVEDLGPKRARQLQVALGIQTVADLVKAAEAGKIQSLPGFSEVMETKLLENARRVKERTRRFTLAEVEDDVAALLKKIRSVPGVERCEAAGSFRRRKETVGDIDVLVVTKSAGKVGDAIAALRQASPFAEATGDRQGDKLVRDVVAHGEKKLSFDLQSGIRVDIRFVKRDQWGAALLYFTGSKEHNIALRKRAIQRGWKLNEYGLFEGEKAIASREEEDIYQALGFPLFDPTKRTEELKI